MRRGARVHGVKYIMKSIAKILRNILALVGFISIGIFFLQALSSHHRCRSALEVKALADLRVIGSQFELFYEDTGHYPNAVEDLVGSYLKSDPLDPWGNKYQVRVQGDRVYLFTQNLDKTRDNYSYLIEYGI